MSYSLDFPMGFPVAMHHNKLGFRLFDHEACVDQLVRDVVPDFLPR